jgi:hypothetical protein
LTEKHPVQPSRPFGEGEIAWGCALAAMGKFTLSGLRRPTNETWPLAEKLGLTSYDTELFSVRLQPGDDLFSQGRALSLHALVRSMSDEERTPYLALVQDLAQQEPALSDRGDVT